MTNNLGLYIHFPFCRKKCLYCDFYSVEKTELQKSYISALARQIESLETDKTVDTVYFGGGTPSLMDAADVDALLGVIAKRFHVSRDCEISLEANPNSLDYDKLSGYRRAGVNRVSIGMQSAHDSELARLGRLHRHTDTVRAAEAARQAGFDNLSLDLIYGLPEQSLSDWRQSLSAAAELSPEHISFYCLTLEEDAPLLAKDYSYPDDDASRAMYEYALGFLRDCGYERYEISNAAKPGYNCRHNEKYWDLSEYYGFGPSAHSYYGGRRFSVANDLPRYLKAGSFRSLTVDAGLSRERDIAEEYIMLSLRTSAGLSFGRMSELGVNEKRFPVIREALEAVTDAGCARPTADGYTLTDNALFVSNTVIVQVLSKVLD